MEPQLDNGDSSDNEETRTNSLHIAFKLKNERPDMIRRLLDRGAPALTDVDERDKLLQTPLDVASRLGTLETSGTPIKYGADVNCRDSSAGPRHPVAHCSKVWAHDVVRLLLDNGVDINATEWEYYTALHVATVPGHFKIVQLLFEQGVNVQLRDIQYLARYLLNTHQCLEIRQVCSYSQSTV